MGEKVEQLLKYVPADCHGLTLHDISHLDAVWEMASLVAGEDYPLNPAEAFVLGAAILVHDAGLTAAAYKDGLDEVMATSQFKDIAAAEMHRIGMEPTDALLLNPPAEIKPGIIFAALRELHAAQAEKMVTSNWTLKNVGEISLIEDLELRQAFGEAIGRVAHSHHWPIEKVADDLRDNVGVGTSLPPEWAVSERKVACILRCADAAHIDRRRAPTISFAATRPVNVSHMHWTAQNKINKPSVDGGTLIYTAGASYDVTEAEAWWVTYDLIRLIDSEVRSANTLLEELGFSRFRVVRVLGADSPRAMAKQIRTDNWQPIDAEVRVSDPINLAMTLGGRHLYGRDALAPIRELMQNSADAIRARRLLEDRGLEFGLIEILVDHDADDPNACIFSINDDGIGMTERVLSGPLIDFGKSIWTSKLLQTEFPGLQAKGVKPIGKFGIGFFSIFELADNVRVVSKHFERGLDQTRVLEFASLKARPHIRPAAPKELPRDCSTRIVMKVKDKTRLSGPHSTDYTLHRMSWARLGSQRISSFSEALLSMIVMLDVKVLYQNRIDGSSFEHSADVYATPSKEFLDELLAASDSKAAETAKLVYSPMLDVVAGENGQRHGRAAMIFAGETHAREYGGAVGRVSVGGFVYESNSRLGVNYIGVIEGDTEEAARRMASANVSSRAIAHWASNQAKLIDPSKFRRSELVALAEKVKLAAGDPGDLPYCFHEGALVSFSACETKLAKLQTVKVLLNLEYNSRFKTRPYALLRPIHFELPMRSDVFAIGAEENVILDEEIVRLITKEGKTEITPSDLKTTTSLGLFMSLIKETWGGVSKLSVQGAQTFQATVFNLPDVQWVLSISK